jgi:dCTP deaminase
VPRTFGLVVRRGDRLNQVRFLRGIRSSSDKQLGKLHDTETLAYIDDQPAEADIGEGLRISIDLLGSRDAVVGYVAKRHTDFIDLSRINYYDPADFWQPLTRPKNGRLILDLDEFYIFASREKVRIPDTHAAEMVAYDPSMGEFRIHYAGFFDPGFGYGKDDIRGARAVLEIRSHEVPFCLEDQQTVGRLKYEPLVERAHITYGVGIGSSYQSQDLMLSKQFRRSSASS